MTAQQYAEERVALWLKAHPRFLSNEAEQDLIVEFRNLYTTRQEMAAMAVKKHERLVELTRLAMAVVECTDGDGDLRREDVVGPLAALERFLKGGPNG